MPSPFPGMDPYLEHPALFPGLHDRFIVVLSEALQASLPEPYYAEISEKLWVEVSQRDIEPDVNVVLGEPRGERGEAPREGGAGVATVVRNQPVVVTMPFVEERNNWVEVRARRGVGDDDLVASIEVLSLSNKTPGRHGRELYLRKQTELLDSQTHLIEIDLLRGGRHTTAVPRARIEEKTGPFDYHVSIHRFDHFEDFLIYPIRLAVRLPEIAVPLLPGDPDVPIDLQAAFDRCYDTGPYRRRVRYHEMTPVPPLRPDQAEWAASLLARAGAASPPQTS